MSMTNVMTYVNDKCHDICHDKCHDIFQKCHLPKNHDISEKTSFIENLRLFYKLNNSVDKL